MTNTPGTPIFLVSFYACLDGDEDTGLPRAFSSLAAARATVERDAAAMKVALAGLDGEGHLRFSWQGDHNAELCSEDDEYTTREWTITETSVSDEPIPTPATDLAIAGC